MLVEEFLADDTLAVLANLGEKVLLVRVAKEEHLKELFSRTCHVEVMIPAEALHWSCRDLLLRFLRVHIEGSDMDQAALEWLYLRGARLADSLLCFLASSTSREDILLRLSTSDSAAVRWRVAYNDYCPRHVLQILAEGSSRIVSYLARGKLERLSKS